MQQILNYLLSFFHLNYCHTDFQKNKVYKLLSLEKSDIHVNLVLNALNLNTKTFANLLRSYLISTLSFHVQGPKTLSIDTNCF